jgi:phage terminase small subunit
MTTKRVRKDTVAGAIQAMADVQKTIEPSMPLGDRESYFFKIILESRESSSWSKNDIHLATMLSRFYWQQEELTAQLMQEGYVIANPRGTQIANPVFNAQLQITGSIDRLTKTLGLSASQRGMTGDEQQKRNQADRDARAVIDKIKDDSEDLLA